MDKNKVTPTLEQEIIAKTNSNKLQVNAFAGTGKTTALKLFCEENQNKKILYMCYNKSMQLEAQEHFSSNTKTLTAHSLAYRKIGYQFKNQLKGYLSITDLQKFLNLNIAPILIKHISKTLENYVQSDSREIKYEHVPIKDLSLLKIDDLSEDSEVVKKIMQEANHYWQAVKNRMAPVITHDMYLKLYQLTNPKLDREFDAILLDEAQDANPVILDIFLNQNNLQQILVGDQHQAIYGWRGALNALNKKDNFEELYLTESFRFGQNIADLANLLLLLKGEKRELKGNNYNTYLGALKPRTKNHTMLFRYNYTLFQYACSLIDGMIDGKKNNKIYIEGGLNAYVLNDLYALIDFYSLGKSNHILYSQFKSYHEFKDQALKTDNIEALKMIHLIDSYGHGLKNKLKRLENDQLNLNKNNCDYYLLTAHKSKGMEYDNLEVYSDFNHGPFEVEHQKLDKNSVSLPYLFIPDQSKNEILNLLYVAITRAKQELYLPKSYLEMYEIWKKVLIDKSITKINQKEIFIHPKTRNHLEAMEIEKALSLKIDTEKKKSFKKI